MTTQIFSCRAALLALLLDALTHSHELPVFSQYFLSDVLLVTFNSLFSTLCLSTREHREPRLSKSCHLMRSHPMQRSSVQIDIFAPTDNIKSMLREPSCLVDTGKKEKKEYLSNLPSQNRSDSGGSCAFWSVRT